jgi:CheY-specific phosphatase CheX
VRAEQQILVIDQARGMLSGVMDELDELGFRVIWVPTLEGALEFLAGGARLSLIIASAASGRGGSLEFLVKAREFAPNVRIIWGARSNQHETPERTEHGGGPDSLLPEPFRPDDLRQAISELLAEHFYPTAVADAIKTAALEVLGSRARLEVEGGAFLVANSSALSDVSAVIPFSGDLSGHLMMGMTRRDAELLYRAFVPGAPSARLDRMEDFVGEICNQVLGRINAFFTLHAMTVQHGTPIFIRAAGSTMRFPAGRPSFAVTLAGQGMRIALEYYLAEFEATKLQAPDLSRIQAAGEVYYY